MPPIAYRQWVGPTEPERYDNPQRSLVYPDFAAESYESVFDFGCGCGRVARQLILQNPRPGRYVGVDVHPDLIAWCRENLTPAAPGFEFVHHDVFDRLVNADEAKPEVLPLPVEDESVTFFEGLSIFTHIVERQFAFYLCEAARVLRPGGVMNASFLLFDKADFPVLGADRNSLYIDDAYPPAAVYYDREWFQQTLADAGLAVVGVAQAPEIRGYQWRLALSRTGTGVTGIAIPRDPSERGVPQDARNGPAA
jgi:SAM-dependent methyltransferase